MRILIAGVDGYLGWPLALHLASKGHELAGIDCYYRREWVREVGSHSATPIASMPDRLAAFSEHYSQPLPFFEGDLTDYEFVEDVFQRFRPEAIVHVGQMPSAPYSMIDVKHAVWTQTNNIVGNLNLIYAIHNLAPDAHLVKLGTMGEYGTPGIDIPEGYFDIEYRGRKGRLPFPRQAGSWYHQSKVHDSNNVMMACRLWGLRATNIMQGVVFGTRTDEIAQDERFLTRLDFDQCFGTVINRFVCQVVIGEPITPYGKGLQKRGFLPLRDSMQCLRIALENPPNEGECRVFNQFQEVHDVTDLAQKVYAIAKRAGLDARIANVENPRTESEDHYYAVDHQQLFDLGYVPTHDVCAEIEVMLKDLLPHKDRIIEKKDRLMPDIRWDGRRLKSRYL